MKLNLTYWAVLVWYLCVFLNTAWAQADQNFLVVITADKTDQKLNLINEWKAIVAQREGFEWHKFEVFEAKDSNDLLRLKIDEISSLTTSSDRFFLYFDNSSFTSNSHKTLSISANDLFLMSQKVWCNQQFIFINDHQHELATELINLFSRNIEESYLMNANRVVYFEKPTKADTSFFEIFKHHSEFKLAQLFQYTDTSQNPLIEWMKKSDNDSNQLFWS